MKPIIVIGGGGHAKVLISVLKKKSEFNLIGFTDERQINPVLGIDRLGDDSVLPEVKKKYPDCAAAIGVGSLGISDKRKMLFDLLKSYGYSLPVIISPGAVVNEQVSIGEGSAVFDGAVVNSGTKIGLCSIINSNATVEHDCEIGDFVHIAPGAVLSGGVKIGPNSMVGAGATVIQYKTVGARCVIGAGAAVVEDCLEPGIFTGVPARRRK